MYTQHHWVNDLHEVDEVPSGTQWLCAQDQGELLDGGHQLWYGMEREGSCHATLPKSRYMKMTSTHQHTVTKPTQCTQHNAICKTKVQLVLHSESTRFYMSGS